VKYSLFSNWLREYARSVRVLTTFLCMEIRRCYVNPFAVRSCLLN
jgi:hypothetical protein